MPQTNGKAHSSIFVYENDTFDPEAFKEACVAKYGLIPQYDWAMRTFGGA